MLALEFLGEESAPAKVVDRLLDLLLVACLLGAPLIFYTHGYDVFEFNKITALRVFTSLAAVLMAFKFLLVRPLRLTRSPLDLPVLAWLVVAGACTFHTVNRRLSLHGVFEDFEGFTTWAMYVFLFWFTLQQVRSERQIRLVLGSVALAGTVAGFYGLLQNFGIDFVPWNPDTYNPNRMFSTMGNPNFLAAYTVMSMPITLAIFLDLPDKIRTDKAFCAVLVVLGLLASAGACVLFHVNYFDFSPTTFGAQSFLGIFATQKFWATKLLLAFPLVCGVLLYQGRLRWILLLSLFGQLVSTLYTKSRGGVFAMASIGLLFGGAAAWEAGRWKGLLGMFGGLAAIALVLATGLWENIYALAFTDLRLASFIVFVAALAGLRWLIRRGASKGVFIRSLDYIIGLLIIIWLAHLVPVIRQTSFEMLERTSKLFHLGEVKYTPRLFIWKSALAMLRDNFWLGKGLDTFQISFPPYREAIYWSLEWNGTPEKAHNFVMQTAATMGFLGMLAFAWMHYAFIRGTVRDWLRQPDERRRMLILAAFGAWMAFFVQNLFSFTVVGYGSLWWVLWGLVPAMQRTWEGGGISNSVTGASPEVPARPSAGLEGRLAWSAGLMLVGILLSLAAWAGPTFFATDTALALRATMGLLGLGTLAWVLIQGPHKPAGPAGLGLIVALVVGAFFFSWFSVRCWVADSFYKQGQIGMNANQIGYAANMYQKAAGRLDVVNAEQVAALVEPDVPTDPAKRLVMVPGLNPDQELIWVKLGITLEQAAAMSEKPDEKMAYYRTALAVHQYTLQMNPLNGYNYNNKGRVLKSMGEAFNDQGLSQKALLHYDKAMGLDVNNVYFAIDKATTLLNLGRRDEALAVLGHIIEKFPDFAMPYSYVAYIQMKSGLKDQAIANFERSLAGDWKKDVSSRALAGTNLGTLYMDLKRYDDAARAFTAAIETNPRLPEPYLRLALARFKQGRKPDGYNVLRALLQAVPGQPDALEIFKRDGVQP